MALTSVAAIIEEGGFCKEQFPESASVARDQAAFEVLVTGRLNEAAAELRLSVGATNYASADADTAAALTTAEKYAACAKCFTTMINTIAAWDAEVLPSEFVESDTCERQRDWYTQEARSIASRFATTPYGRTDLPGIISSGISPVPEYSPFTSETYP